MPLQWLITGLWASWFKLGEKNMDYELTPERVMEIGKMWGKSYLKSLPPEERLYGLKPEERLAGLKSEEILARLSVKEIEAYLKFRYKDEAINLAPMGISKYFG